MSLRNFPTTKKRRAYIEEELNIDLSPLEDQEIEEGDKVFCENLIGSSKIPLGVAGPLILRRGRVEEKVFFPLATTEGALVASVSRGCKALSQSGGVSTYSMLSGQTRGPVFYTKNIANGLKLREWIEENEKVIDREASKTSTHIKYLGAKVKVVGPHTFVRFSFNTDDAMGMNMVTIAVEKISDFIENKLNFKLMSVAGNFDIDKKASWLNVIEGRGFEVFAESLVKEKVLEETLHTSAKRIYDVWLAKCMVGSYASGALGYNAHFANIVASIFIATGQDPAHVVEGSTGITHCEIRGNDLFISINMPSLLVGVVGGGTVLPTQNASLSVMGINKKSKSEDLANKIAGAVIAGELSLLASLSAKTLGRAHKKLGRIK